MPSPNSPERNKTKKTFALIAEIGSLLFFGSMAFSFWVAHFNNYDRDLLSDNVYHRSERPFVYRTLLPTTVNVLTRAFPASSRELAERFVRTNPLMQKIFTVERSSREASGGLKFEKHYPIETVIALVLMFGCLLGFLVVSGHLYRYHYDGAYWFAALVPAMAAIGFVPWISYTSHPYDLTTLLLSSLFYSQMANEKWRGLLLVFLLACLNKETALLNTIVFAIYRWHGGLLARRSTVLLLTAQAAIFVVIKMLLNYTFRWNKGSVLEFHLFNTNMDIFAHWLRGGYSLVALAALVAFLIGIFHAWREKPPLFRCGLAVIPPLAILGLFFGVFDEWRQYTDAYTPLLMLTLGSIGWLFGARPKRVLAVPLHSTNFGERR